MGNPEWADEEIFADRLKRARSTGTRSRFFSRNGSAQQTVLDLYHKVQAKRVPFAPVSTMGDLLNSEHLKARGFFVEIAHPVAGTHKYPGAPLKYRRDAVGNSAAGADPGSAQCGNFRRAARSGRGAASTNSNARGVI